ncbi:MAG: DMT family transporter [Desulfobulbaceae bacterium]
MKRPVLSDSMRGNTALLLATLAWGTTFVVQRTAMDHLGPFTYSGLRFLLGALFLLPFALYRYRTRKVRPAPVHLAFGASLLTGFLVFLGINLQQIGLVSSTAGKGGFITGLYVIIVPIYGVFFGQRAGPGVWTGALLAVAGLYLLSVTGGIGGLAPGDGWILAGAFVWALQVHALSWLSPKMDWLLLALGQSLVCSLFSLGVGLVLEPVTFAAVSEAGFDILYGGIVSVGIGYTLQVVGQRYARAAHAAIIMQMEAVVAVGAGWLFLGEVLTPRGMVGCLLMLAGMLVAELVPVPGRERSGPGG